MFSAVVSKLNSGSTGFLSQVNAVETIDTNESIGLKKVTTLATSLPIVELVNALVKLETKLKQEGQHLVDLFFFLCIFIYSGGMYVVFVKFMGL